MYACHTITFSCLSISVSHQALLNLLLTGRANPHVFNGTVLYDENGGVLEHPLHGVLARSDVGYLHWSREQLQQGRLPVVRSNPSDKLINIFTPGSVSGRSLGLIIILMEVRCFSTG